MRRARPVPENLAGIHHAVGIDSLAIDRIAGDHAVHPRETQHNAAAQRQNQPDRPLPIARGVSGIVRAAAM